MIYLRTVLVVCKADAVRMEGTKRTWLHARPVYLRVG